MKKGNELLFIMLGVIITITILLIIILTNLSLLHLLNDDYEDGTYKIIDEYGRDDGQSIEIEEYLITLEKTIYNKKMEFVYCMFRVTGDKKISANISPEGTLIGGFGDDNRFSFKVIADASNNGYFKAKYDGDDLILYGHFAYHCDVFKDEQAICLYDKLNVEQLENNNEYEECVAKFSLEPNVENLEFVNNGDFIYISPFSIKTESESEEKMKTETFVICYKDGKQMTVIDNDKWKGVSTAGSSTTKNRYTESYIFESMIDITEIESIIYNGEKLSVTR